MNVQPWMYNRGHEIKSYSPLLLNVTPCRNKMTFWYKICCFWAQEFFWAHTFQVEFYDFRQESSFLILLMVRKGQGFFFISEKGQGAFLISKKQQGAILIFEKRQGIFSTFEKKARRIFDFWKKGRAYFWLLKKRQGAAPSEKFQTWTLFKTQLVVKNSVQGWKEI